MNVQLIEPQFHTFTDQDWHQIEIRYASQYIGQLTCLCWKGVRALLRRARVLQAAYIEQTTATEQHGQDD